MKRIIKWLIPLVLIGLGIFCYATVHGHEFLGLICFGLSGISIAYILFGIFRARHLRRIFTILLCVGILIFAVTEAIVLSAINGDPDTACEYIIVLGAKVDGQSPAMSLRSRIDAAYHFLIAHPDTIAVLSGGQGEDEEISEAQCMFNYLTAMGIAEDRLWLEDKSTSTWENLQFSLAVIDEKAGAHPEKIGILSSEYHLFRAGLFAKDCGFEAIGIPAHTPQFSIRINYFLREVAGVWHYFILGGQYND